MPDAGRIERTVERFTAGSTSHVYTFLNFIFTWIGKAWDAIWRIILSAAFGSMLIMLASIAAIAYVGWNISKTDSRIDYCTITQEADDYTLKGHRPWRLDSTLMKKTSREPLLDAAKQMNCPLH